TSWNLRSRLCGPPNPGLGELQIGGVAPDRRHPPAALRSPVLLRVIRDRERVLTERSDELSKRLNAPCGCLARALELVGLLAHERQRDPERMILTERRIERHPGGASPAAKGMQGALIGVDLGAVSQPPGRIATSRSPHHFL